MIPSSGRDAVRELSLTVRPLSGIRRQASRRQGVGKLLGRPRRSRRDDARTALEVERRRAERRRVGQVDREPALADEQLRGRDVDERAPA